MRFLLRCFGARLDLKPEVGATNDGQAKTATSRNVALSAGQEAGIASTVLVPELASKAEGTDAERNANTPGAGVVQVMAEDEGERQGQLGAPLDVRNSISLGSPVSLFASPSVATHQSITLKLQYAARTVSTGPADNWVALGSVADARTNSGSGDRATGGSNPSVFQRQLNSKADVHRTSTSSSSGVARAAAASSSPPAPPLASPPPVAPPQPQVPSQSQTWRKLKSEPLATTTTTSASNAGSQGMPMLGQTSDVPGLPACSIQNEAMCTSLSHWSGSSCSIIPVHVGGSTSRRHAVAASSLGGSVAAWPPPVTPAHAAAPRPEPAEELASLVTGLGRVRGHWLEALGSVVGLAAELLGADSLSVFLLSDSGTTHAALACHGDAGGAIRLGIPLPTTPPPDRSQTALQRLYLTGEPQRGSVWGLPQYCGQQAHPQQHLHQHLHTRPQRVVHSATQPHLEPPAPQQPQPPANKHSLLPPLMKLQYPPGHPHMQPQQQHQQRRQHVPAHAQSAHVCPMQPPPSPQQQQQQGVQMGLPPDWQAMRVLAGMTDFVAVPLLRGESVIGALQVADICTPSEDNTFTMPTSRRCRGTAELAIVAAFIAALLVDHEVLCLLGALEAVAAAHDVDGLVRGLARHVSLFCRMRQHITPGVRVALIRGDAASLALFLDEGATAAATAAAAAATPGAGAAGGSTTPVGVLSAAVSRYSTARNLQAMSATFVGWPTLSTGGAGFLSSSCTPEVRLLVSGPGPGSQRSGSDRGRAGGGGGSGSAQACPVSDATSRYDNASRGGAGAGAAPPCTLPLYAQSPASCTRMPYTILDTDLSMAGAAAAAAGTRAVPELGSASSIIRAAAGAAVDAGSVALQSHVRSNASMSCNRTDRATGMTISTAAELWPWFGSSAGNGGGGGSSAAPTATTSTATGMVTATAAAAVAVAATTRTACEARGDYSTAMSTAMLNLASALSEESVVVVGSGLRESGLVDDMSAVASTDMLSPIPEGPGPRVVSVCAESEVTAAPVVITAAAAAAAASGDHLQACGPPGSGGAAAAAAAAGASTSALAALLSMGPASAPLPVPCGAGLPMRMNRSHASGGVYGKALAMAGDEGGGRGPGQVQGHAMLTRGTVLAEALAAGTGMYITDVAIYMQDGRNKSRDVFLAPSGRGGPAQATNCIAVTTVSYAGVPLVGLYLTYWASLPANLLNALITKVHLFGAMLGPLLYERLHGGDSDLADEWRYLLGEMLDPTAIQKAADEQRSRRSSAALYNQQQQQHHHPQQQHAPPPHTGPPSPIQILTGVAASTGNSTSRGQRLTASHAGPSPTPVAATCVLAGAGVSAVAASAGSPAGSLSSGPGDGGGSSVADAWASSSAIIVGAQQPQCGNVGSRCSRGGGGGGRGGGAGGAAAGRGGDGPGSLRRSQTADGVVGADGGIGGHLATATSCLVGTKIPFGAFVGASDAIAGFSSTRLRSAQPGTTPQVLPLPLPLQAAGGGGGSSGSPVLVAAIVGPQAEADAAAGEPDKDSATTIDGKAAPIAAAAAAPLLNPGCVAKFGRAPAVFSADQVAGNGSESSNHMPSSDPHAGAGTAAAAAAPPPPTVPLGCSNAPCGVSVVGRAAAAAHVVTSAVPIPIASGGNSAGASTPVAAPAGNTDLSPQSPGTLWSSPTLLLGISDYIVGSSGGSVGVGVGGYAATAAAAGDGKARVLRPVSTGLTEAAADARASGGDSGADECGGDVTLRTSVLAGVRLSTCGWLEGAVSGARPSTVPAPPPSVPSSSPRLLLAPAAAAAAAPAAEDWVPGLGPGAGFASFAVSASHVDLWPHLRLMPASQVASTSVCSGAGSSALLPNGSTAGTKHGQHFDLELSVQTSDATITSSDVLSVKGLGQANPDNLAPPPRLPVGNANSGMRLQHTRPAGPSPLSPYRLLETAPAADVEVALSATAAVATATLPGALDAQGCGIGSGGRGGGGGGGGGVQLLALQLPARAAGSLHLPQATTASAAGLNSGLMSPETPTASAAAAPPASPRGCTLAASGAVADGCAAAAVGQLGVLAVPPALPRPLVRRLRCNLRRNTSFNIMADSGVQDTGKVAPVMANLQDKLRSLQAEQVLARLHDKGAGGADELSGLTVLEPLGSGGFGTVFRGIFNGIEVAVKVLCERGAGGRSEAATMREAFELAVMTTISHPHIVQVLSAFTDVILTTQPDPQGGPRRTVLLPRSSATEELGEPTVVIAMEYCDAGSLADAVAAGCFRQPVPRGYGALQPSMPAIYATLLEIALALRHMHAMLLVHCDLKPANILLKSNMRDPRGFSAKLSDFGLVKMVVEDGSGGGGGVIGRDARTGTVTHMAPELIRATEASKMDASVDIYAFGVLMCELLSTAPVYLGLRSEDIRRGVVEGRLRPEFPSWADEKYRALAEACLSADPRARPSSPELVARLRALLAESGALQDTIKRRPCQTTAFASLHFARGPGGGGGGGAFPGANTAAAAGALLGIGPSEFSRPSRLLQPPSPLQHAQQQQQQQQQRLPPNCYPPGAHGPQHQSRLSRSRSFSGGNDTCTFPLHIL